MLETIGVSSIEDLFTDIPPGLRAREYRLPAGLSEFEVCGRMRELAEANRPPRISFLGGGFYDHFIPAAVDALAGRSEFYTAYTPYQPECSQGTLQALYEYQTAICRLTGLDVANSSNYDGGTALAEAVLMAMRITGRAKVLLDGAINPLYRAILGTYLSRGGAAVEEAAPDGCESDLEGLARRLDSDTAAVAVQTPNFFGSAADVSPLSEAARKLGALVIVSSYPVSLGLLKSPGEMGADIAAGEAQSLGNPLNFGGPYLGFIAAAQEHLRALPGRVAGATFDGEGRRGFVLTLQAREQHIRRARATSNICTNQGLCALRALIHLTLLGREGLRELARLNYDKAHYAMRVLGSVQGVEVGNRGAVFNEFTLRLPRDARGVCARLLREGIAPGIPLGEFFPRRERELLTTVTEKNSRAQIEEFARALGEALRP